MTFMIMTEAWTNVRRCVIVNYNKGYHDDSNTFTIKRIVVIT